VVVIDEPKGYMIYGGQVAAPVFSRVMQYALRAMRIPPPTTEAVQPPATLGAVPPPPAIPAAPPASPPPAPGR
jgi:hypothetical protein